MFIKTTGTGLLAMVLSFLFASATVLGLTATPARAHNSTYCGTDSTSEIRWSGYYTVNYVGEYTETQYQPGYGYVDVKYHEYEHYYYSPFSSGMQFDHNDTKYCGLVGDPEPINSGTGR